MNLVQRRELIAIGAADPAPLPLLWRALRAVYAFRANPTQVLWATSERANLVVGFVSHRDDFDRCVAEGTAIALPYRMRLNASRVTKSRMQRNG
jgi:hypothetical protein